MEEIVREIDVKGKIGIGHTRWATHGIPSDINSHPHADCTGRIVVVHNGIIENYKELKKKLIASGHKFKSETDTEVIPHLIEEELKKQNDFLEAVRKAVKKLEGSFALVILFAKNSSSLVAVRKDSPLIIGIGEDGIYVVSDVPVFLPWTNPLCSNNYIYINEINISFY